MNFISERTANWTFYSYLLHSKKIIRNTVAQQNTWKTRVNWVGNFNGDETTLDISKQKKAETPKFVSRVEHSWTPIVNFETIWARKCLFNNRHFRQIPADPSLTRQVHPTTCNSGSDNVPTKVCDKNATSYISRSSFFRFESREKKNRNEKCLSFDEC